MTAASGMRILRPNWGFATTTPTLNNHTVDASTEGVAWAFRSKTTDAITHLGYRYGARTGTPPTYIIGLEGASTSTGFPDGTYKTNGGNCSATFTPPADTSIDGKWQWVALSNSYTPSLNELLVSTIRHSSGTIDASNNSSFTTDASNIDSQAIHFPYALRNTSGTWAFRVLSPVFGYRTASGRYGYIIESLYTTRTASTVGHRVAAKVTLPGGFGSTFTVSAMRAAVSIAAATGKAPLAKIWSASSALASVTLDSDQVASSASNAYKTYETGWTTEPTLDFGTSYYFGYEVADATNGGIVMYGTQAAEADDLASEDGGAQVCLSTFDGSSWTDNTLVRPFMELILDDWTEPSASGGGGSVIGSTMIRGVG